MDAAFPFQLSFRTRFVESCLKLCWNLNCFFIFCCQIVYHTAFNIVLVLAVINCLKVSHQLCNMVIDQLIVANLCKVSIYIRLIGKSIFRANMPFIAVNNIVNRLQIAHLNNDISYLIDCLCIIHVVLPFLDYRIINSSVILVRRSNPLSVIR